MPNTARQSGVARIDAQALLNRWTNRSSAEGNKDTDTIALMRSVNPAIIPRNHQIEAMIENAANGDLQLLQKLNAAFASPFDENPEYVDLMEAPQTDQLVKATFCGT